MVEAPNRVAPAQWVLHMPLLSDLLRQVPREVRTRVGKAKDQARAPLRDALRAVTRLSMNSAGGPDEATGRAQVPIHLSDALPDGIAGVQISDNQARLAIAAPHIELLRSISRGAPDLEQLNRDLARLPGQVPATFPHSGLLRDVGAWAAETVAAIEVDDPIKVILNFDKDVLGSYRFDSTEHRQTVANAAAIQLYWMPIGLVAVRAGISVEDLTVVVLAHELAHAYTQLGANIDGLRWAASAFGRSEPALVEALAQYYTLMTLRRTRARFPGALAAFHKLLPWQPPIYHGHKEWAEEVSPEAVRSAMLQVRGAELRTLAEFKDCLRSAITVHPQADMKELESVNDDEDHRRY